jgi:uncharacterized protein
LFTDGDLMTVIKLTDIITRKNKIDQLEARDSTIHGQGLFTRVDISGRCKLGEITGRLVKLPQARRKIETQPAIYFIELNDRYALDCSNGNIFKYLNHSCKPNCYLRIFRMRVEVYSLDYIEAGSELTLDYEETPHKNGMICTCGVDRCRGKI